MDDRPKIGLIGLCSRWRLGAVALPAVLITGTVLFSLGYTPDDGLAFSLPIGLSAGVGMIIGLLWDLHDEKRRREIRPEWILFHVLYAVLIVLYAIFMF